MDRKALGLPEDEAFIADYCRRMGIGGIGDFGFYLAFAFFKMGAILQGVKKRALEGNASNPDQALRLGASVPDHARGGLQAQNGSEPGVPAVRSLAFGGRWSLAKPGVFG